MEVNIDKDLIQKCCAGDDRSIAALYRKLYSLMMSISVRYQADRPSASSAVNAGFLKILDNLDNYDLALPLGAWVRRIMINHNIDEIRKINREKAKRKSYDQQLDNYDKVEFNDAFLDFEAEELLSFVNQLPDKSKQVFNLFAIDGYGHKEIAEMLNLSEGTSKWHVSNARKLLIAMMVKHQTKNIAV